MNCAMPVRAVSFCCSSSETISSYSAAYLPVDSVGRRFRLKLEPTDWMEALMLELI